MCFLVIFAFMRLLMFFILLLAFGCQRTTGNGQQSSFTVGETSIYETAKNHKRIADSLFFSGDNIGACENYFKSIELCSEDLKNKELNKKYNYMISSSCFTLGYIYLDNSFASNAVDILRKSYEHSVSDSISAHILKLTGMAYMAIDNDSAFHYFDKCMETDPSNYFNQIDINKCVAMMLFYDEGEKDSAYAIMRKTFDIIEHDNVRESYYTIYGEMLYEDKQYDSAIYYLEKAIGSSEYFLNLGSAEILANIYDSIGNEEKRIYYNDIASQLAYERVDTEFDRLKIQDMYNVHKTKMHEMQKAKVRKNVIMIVTPCLIIIAVVIFFVVRRNRKIVGELSDTINDIRFRHSLVEGRIRSKNMELQKLSEQIKAKEEEIVGLKSKLEKGNSGLSNLKAYYQSEVCSKILDEIDELSGRGIDTSDLHPLSQEEFGLLLQSANIHLGGFIEDISVRLSKFKKEDLYYLCLVIVNLNDKQIASLFGVTYSTIRSRRNNICAKLGINSSNLNNFLTEII